MYKSQQRLQVVRHLKLPGMQDLLEEAEGTFATEATVKELRCPFVLELWDEARAVRWDYADGERVYYRPKQRSGVVRKRRRPVEDFNVDHSLYKPDSWSILVDGRVKPKSLTDCSKLLPLTASFGSLLVRVVPDTASFRHWAVAWSGPTDRVLEIGCSTGQTSRAFWKARVSSWVGMDTSSDMVQRTRIALQQQDAATGSARANYRVCHCDALLHPNQAELEARQFGPPTLVFVDIGGNRNLSGVVLMLDWVLTRAVGVEKRSSGERQPTRLVLVKSQALARALSLFHTDNNRTLPESPNENLASQEFCRRWFEDQLRQAQTATLPRHPLQASLVYSPISATQPICRYHNYSTCQKVETCPLDHRHCHLCQRPGHIALRCPVLRADIVKPFLQK